VNVYLHQGRFDKARDELDRIIRSEPNSRSAAQARKILAEISVKRLPLE
jgi:Tfp pilus assembly protein PilF